MGCESKSNCKLLLLLEYLCYQKRKPPMPILVCVCVKIPNANRQIPGNRIYLIKFCNSSHKYFLIALNNEFFTHIFHTEKNPDLLVNVTYLFAVYKQTTGGQQKEGITFSVKILVIKQPKYWQSVYRMECSLFHDIDYPE